MAVFTANVPEAATTAKAYITVYGEKGDSGRRPLADSKTHSTLFLKVGGEEAVQPQTFSFEAYRL